MSEWLVIFLIAVVALGTVFLVWWLFVESEGVYLGRRAVIWLYDVYATRYDNIKGFKPEYDHQFLAQPLMSRLAPNRAPLILDVATGTARLPLAMLNHAWFEGQVVGVDLSVQMLNVAAQKLAGDDENKQVTLLRAPADRLPFADATFDAVTCLEALEFTPSPESSLIEIVRVLKPGGVLLITNRLTGRLMPGKTWTRDALTDLLTQAGIETVNFEAWQVDYERVWGRKQL